MKGLVATDLDKYSVEELTLDGPKAGELRIKMGATGVCHSDLSVINGTLPLPKPLLLGHEGAGVVAELGEGVDNFTVGDHVVLSFVPICGTCYFCNHKQPHLCTVGPPTGRMLDGTARVKMGGQEIAVMQFLGCMAEEAIVPAISAIPIDKSIPFDKAALVGCGVTTGVGAAIRTAQVAPGSTAAVFGCGGVGLSVIQGARLAGAARIIAVDLADNKLEMARNLGATDAVNGGKDNAVSKIMELTGGIGADYTFEAVGVPTLMQQAEQACRRGGTCTIVGVGKLTESVPFNALMLSLGGKTIKGSFYGDCNPKLDFPMYLDLYTNGKLNLDDMVTSTYKIEDAPQAIEDMQKGLNARGVIVY